jgi:hypothetical protein
VPQPAPPPSTVPQGGRVPAEPQAPAPRKCVPTQCTDSGVTRRVGARCRSRRTSRTSSAPSLCSRASGCRATPTTPSRRSATPTSRAASSPTTRRAARCAPPPLSLQKMRERQPWWEAEHRRTAGGPHTHLDTWPIPREERCLGWLGVSCPHVQPGTPPVVPPAVSECISLSFAECISHHLRPA